MKIQNIKKHFCRKIYFCLGVISLFFVVGCGKVSSVDSLEPEGTGTREEVSAENNDATDVDAPRKSAEEVYYEKYRELATKYGEPAIIEGVEEGKLQMGLHSSYLTGVCVVDLLDFNQDEEEDLFLVYATGETSGTNSDEQPIPLASDYRIEIWTYTDGELRQLLARDKVSSFFTFQTEYWDTEDCFLTVFENEEGTPVIQIYDEKENGYTYTNLYMKKEKVIEDVFSYEDGIFKKNEKEIQEESWEQETIGFDTVWISAFLSSDDISWELMKEEWHLDMSAVLERTKMRIEELSCNMSDYWGKVKAIHIPVYQKELLRLNRECKDSGGGMGNPSFAYVLCDMDKNGMPELLTKTGSCEADFQIQVHTIVDGELHFCGEFYGGHSTLYAGNEPGLICYEGHMGVYHIRKYSLEENILTEEIIAEGETEADYPSLEELGYGEYTSLGLCYGAIFQALYQSRDVFYLAQPPVIDYPDTPLVLKPEIRNFFYGEDGKEEKDQWCTWEYAEEAPNFGFIDWQAPGCSSWCAVVDFSQEAEASSTLRSNSDRYAAENVLRQNRKFAWAEGVEGSGIGESVTYKQSCEYPFRCDEDNMEYWDGFMRYSEICIVNGYARDAKTWEENGRIKRLLMYAEDKPYAYLELEDTILPQYFHLPEDGIKVVNKDEITFRFVIEDVYPGSLYEDTCLTGLVMEFTGRHAH